MIIMMKSKKIFCLALAWMCAIGLWAQVFAGGSKMSPWLLDQYRQQQTAVRQNGGPLRVQGRPVMKYMLALVKSTDGAATVWQKGGVVWHDFGSGICAAFLPMDSLGVLDQCDAILRMEANQMSASLNDTSAVILGVDKLASAAAPLPQAFTGKGVCAAVMDIGFDFTHPAFRHADGTSRIQWFWDPMAPDANDDVIGMFYTLPEQVLLARHCINAETDDHGCHVMGSMAGSGLDGHFVGMAPEADIRGAYLPLGHMEEEFLNHFADYVSRHLKIDIPMDETLLDVELDNVVELVELAKIFEAADVAGQPCVVNWSFGADPNFLDDLTLYEQVFNGLVGPGHIVAIAAGNSGGSMTYLKKYASEPLDHDIYLKSSPEPYYSFAIRGEGDAPDFILTMSFDGLEQSFVVDTRVVKEAESTGREYQDSILLPKPDGWDDDSMGEYVPEENKLYLHFATTPLAGGRIGYGVVMKFPADLTQDTDIKGRLQIDTPVELEMIRDTRVTGKVEFSDKTAKNSRGCNISTLGAPAHLERAITVGAMHHRTEFTNINGEPATYIALGSEEGHLSSFSSCGPTVEGRIKPDVVAPGHNILSALNSFYRKDGDVNATEAETIPRTAYRARHFGRDYAMWAMSGTSMATPITSGVIALWLQAKPDLTPEDIHGVIERTSHQPEPDFSGTDKNVFYGWGEIDAYAGLLDILGLATSVPGLSQHQPKGVTFRMNGNQLFIDGAADGTPVRIYTTDGRLVASVRIAGGSVSLPAGSPAGVYAVQIGTLGSTLIRK